MMGGFLPMLRLTSEGKPFDISEMILHHLADSREWESPFGTVHFPTWIIPIGGGHSIDVSITKHVLFMMISAALVMLVVLIAAQDAKRAHAGGAEVGPKGASNVIEAFILYLRDEVAIKNIGHGGERYAPYVITVFFFILFCNAIGLMPWGASPTGNVTVTATLALITFFIVEIAGMKALGPAGYSKTIFFIPHGLPGWMKPIMLIIMTPVELLGKLAKPFALTIRLYANMTAGHAVVLAFTGLTVMAMAAHAWIVGPAPILMAVGIMVLEIFVALLQAYIFAMLSAVFIGLIRHAH
jgi:F-type H+-transporting ATPase subunit a